MPAVLLVLGCNKSDHEPSSAPPATQASSPAATEVPAPVGAGTEAVTTGGTTARAKGDGTSTACSTDADCRTFSDACGMCSCRPFSRTSPDPKCPAKPATCLIDPCTGLRAYCKKGNCALGGPADGSTGSVAGSDGAAASSKDAASSEVVTKDAATKGASSTSPAASNAPKGADAARK